jgi:hypothetical protein
VLHGNHFNRHALPSEIKDIVMPVPSITERREESASKMNKSLQNAGMAAIKSTTGIIKNTTRMSRTEQTSPLAHRTADHGKGVDLLNDLHGIVKNENAPELTKPKEYPVYSKQMKVEELLSMQKPIDYTELGQKYISELRQELRAKESQESSAVGYKTAD